MSWITENAFKSKSIEDLHSKYVKTIVSIEKRISSLETEKESFIKKYGPKETENLMVQNHTISLSKFALKVLKNEFNELEYYMLDKNFKITSPILLEELQHLTNV